MSYLEPFQSVALFENTFRHQLNKKTGKIDERKFVFNKHFGDGEGQLPVVSDRYRLIWMPGCPHSNKAMITLRLLGLDRVISVGECGVLRDPRGWIFSEDLGGVDPVLKIYYLDDAYLKGDPDFVGRSTVPAIADVTTGAIVQNEACGHKCIVLTNLAVDEPEVLLASRQSSESGDLQGIAEIRHDFRHTGRNGLGQ